MIRVLLCVVLSGVSLWASAASEVTVDVTYAEKPPTEFDKSVQYQSALQALVAAELKLLNLDPLPYDEGLKRHYQDWLNKYQERAKANSIPVLPAAMSQFVQWESLFTRVILVKFAPREEKSDTWQMTLQGQAEPVLLRQHYNRISKAGPLGRKLFLEVSVTPMNFSWEDLQLTRAGEFTAPLEKEWLKWFVDGRLPDGVDEIVLCHASCQAELRRWREFDEAKMAQFIAPELMESLLLSIEIKLERQIMEGPRAENKITLSGGVVLTDLDSKRRLHWVDLAGEQYSLKAGIPKEYNSALATLCYRAPLGKFLEFKTLAAQSGLPRVMMTVRLENPAHMGQALRLLEWIKLKAKSMNAEGKLDSFARKEARILIYFVGEGNKFKSLVSNVKELESEWGKPIIVNDQGEGQVYTLPGAAATSP